MDTAQLLADLQAKGAEVELYHGSDDSLGVCFKGGKIKSAIAQETSGVAVRAIKDGKQGFVGSFDTSKSGLERLLTYVDSSLELGDEARFDLPKPQQPLCEPAAQLGFDPDVAKLTVEDLAATGRQVIDELGKRHPDVVFDVELRRSVGTRRLLNSRGVEISTQHSSYLLLIEVNRSRDQDVLFDYEYRETVGREGLDITRPIEEISMRLKWAETLVEVESKRMPILFTPHGSLVVWSPFFQGVSGETVRQGTSPLRDRSGEQIFAPEVQITDDGLLPGGMGSSAFDHEGTPRQTRLLVENGVLKGFVHDLESAHDTGHEPTGNCVRDGVTARPGPSLSNVMIRPGQKSVADLIAGIDRGILVHSVLGEGQGNTLPGSFSNPVDLGYLIEGGEVKGRLKDLSITGNIYEALKDGLGGLSSEVDVVWGTMHMPWLLLNDMSVVSKTP